MKLNKKNNFGKKNKGFTLIEIIVASSIFVIVMFISVGSILSMVEANRRSQSISSVVSNLNIALESMVRDIRTGNEYRIGNGSPESSITFKNYLGQSTSYFLNENFIAKTVNGETGNITAPEVNVESLRFTAQGVGSDLIQPIILLQIKGTVGMGKSLSPFTIQTLLVQRVLDI